MNRAAGLARLADETFDVLIVGGGATGLGAAVDAASRGYRTGLIEAADFASATSSRSTKLIHGGVRYLQQGNVALVREALRERTLLLRNAPHLVHDCPFVVPAYRLHEIAYYGAGLAAYDLLAGRSPLPRSRVVSARQAAALVPRVRRERLRGAVVYHDAQFDDARLAIALARTAVAHGAAIANYVSARGFVYESGRIAGVIARDEESGETLPIRARAVVNAAGIFVDEVRRFDDPQALALLAHSCGSHIVVDADALGDARAALLVPRTSDGRVLFAVPWHGRVLIGTTDIPADGATRNPQPSEDEIAYLLATMNRYLARPLQRDDVRAAWAGLRPLVRRSAATTAALSREHLIDVSPSGLVTIAGGKWTTYRTMAEDVVDAAARSANLAPASSVTATLALDRDDDAERRVIAEADPALAAPLHPAFPYTGADTVYAIRHEMARTVEDVLARRTRIATLDADAARACTPAVEALLAGTRPVRGTR